MKILADPQAVIQWRRTDTAHGDVGLVPTMGGLHAGHRSLIGRCRKENATCAVSLFVNPTQFNDPHDLKTYPDTLDADMAMCREEGVGFMRREGRWVVGYVLEGVPAARLVKRGDRLLSVNGRAPGELEAGWRRAIRQQAVELVLRRGGWTFEVTLPTITLVR